MIKEKRGKISFPFQGSLSFLALSDFRYQLMLQFLTRPFFSYNTFLHEVYLSYEENVFVSRKVESSNIEYGTTKSGKTKSGILGPTGL